MKEKQKKGRNSLGCSNNLRKSGYSKIIFAEMKAHHVGYNSWKRGQWAVYYTSPQFYNTFLIRGSKNLKTFLYFDWLVN